MLLRCEQHVMATCAVGGLCRQYRRAMDRDVQIQPGKCELNRDKSSVKVYHCSLQRELPAWHVPVQWEMSL